MSHESLNYDYVLDKAIALAGTERPKVLDFGCGGGKLLEVADTRGFRGEVWGADTYDAFHWTWSTGTRPARLRAIENGRVPYDDASFDVVIANQVFEHVSLPKPSLKEIARVLKPGGAFLALFPTSDVWFEGHLGLYFVHWLHGWPRLQGAYCRAARRAGFGYDHGDLSAPRWAEKKQGLLRDTCSYHHPADVRRWWREAFGQEPDSLAEDYMAFRLARDPRLGPLRSLTNTMAGRAALTFICHKRAGRVLLVRKTGK